MVRRYLSLMLFLSACECGTIPLAHNLTHCSDTTPMDIWVEPAVATCEEAAAAVTEVIGRGLELDMWKWSADWGFRLQVLRDLTEIGYPKLNGATDDEAHEIAVSGLHPWLLAHEFTHAQHGQGDHCNWSTIYQPRFETFAEDGGGGGHYQDDCAEVICYEGSSWQCTPAP